MRTLILFKLFLGVFGVFIAVTSSAVTCDEAKEYLIQATAQIKANHQSHDSFNIYNQEKILGLDENILKSDNYIGNLNFIKNNCHI